MKNKISQNSARGFRFTPVRKAILEILKKQNTPITVPEIQHFLEERGLCPNKTTLYRQIETLIGRKMVEKISLKDGITHYEIITSHHHHFICNTCANITCIKDEAFEESMNNVEQNLLKNGFQVQKHNFSLEGKCQTCVI